MLARLLKSQVREEEAQVQQDTRPKLTQVFVHPEHSTPIIVTWDKNSWAGTGIQGTEIFRTHLKHLIAENWIAIDNEAMAPVKHEK